MTIKIHLNHSALEANNRLLMLAVLLVLVVVLNLEQATGRIE